MGSQKIPKVLTADQMKKLVSVIDSPRIMVATLLGFFCGLRISEVCKLRKEDMDFKMRRIHILDSKFGRTRWAELPDNLLPILEKYCNNLVNDYLIYSKKGVNMPIDPKSLREIFNFYLEKAELLIPNFQDCKGRTRYVYHFHTLRHTYASLLLERGFNFVQIRDALGHVSTKTVEIYTHVTNLHEDINEAFFGKEEKPEIRPVKPKTEPIPDRSPLDILRMRLASGEIDLRTF